MNNYTAPYYDRATLSLLNEKDIHYPFSNEEATYIGLDQQYELTSNYFYERGVNLQNEIEGDDPEKVKHFLRMLRLKVYTYIYNHNKSTRQQLNYMIAVRGLKTYPIYEYRQSFLEAMFIEGCYLLANGDISISTGVDFDTMQNMSADVMRNQDRDMHKDCIGILKTLGLKYYKRYEFIPQGKEW